MPESLPELEKQRGDLLLQVAQLGDFRPRSISTTQGRCGNPNCHCHKAERTWSWPEYQVHVQDEWQDCH